MKIDEIRTIVQLMSKHELTEFKIEAEEMRLCIKRGGANATTMVAAPQMMAAPQAVAPASAPAPLAATETESSSDDKNTIDSPIVGTFYASSSPESDAFVSVGTTVAPDTIVCIVEAMKVMNEIKAEKSGVIKELLIDNAQPVEFGQPLFVIE
ncbi:MAG: acetyl-CoA carboxylase biotin carboxyl carrier protein [Victivallales bacterium]|nr:acetyl-CoA carboxylase biotin carboxyl carrier protein [Victivallales bacterium]